MFRLDPMATPNGRGLTEGLPAVAGTAASRVPGPPL